MNDNQNNNIVPPIEQNDVNMVPVNNYQQYQQQVPVPIDVKKKSYLKYIIIGIVVLIIVVLCFSFNSNKSVNNKRVDELTNIKDKKVLKFKIDNKEYSIGDKLKKYKEDFSYIESFDKLDPDSVLLSPFSKDNKNEFLGFIYCPSTDYCKYEDAILIKASFYENSGVKIDEDIDFYSDYDELVEKYGEPSGVYYQDKSMYVWSFGKDIGDPYLIVGFDNGGLWSMGYPVELRLGVWWYEGEYQETVVKESKNEKENNN